MMILLIRKTRDKTQIISGRDVGQPQRYRHTRTQPCTGHEHGDQQAPWIHPQIPLPLVDFSPVIAALGAPISVVLTDWLSKTRVGGRNSRPASTRFRSRKPHRPAARSLAGAIGGMSYTLYAKIDTLAGDSAMHSRFAGQRRLH